MPLLARERLGAIYAVLSGLCYGPMGYFGVRLMEGGLSVYAMIFWRFAISALFMAVLLRFSLTLLTKSPWDTLKTFGYSGLFYSASTIFYFVGSRYIGTGPAIVVFFTYPAIVILINRFFYAAPISRVTYFALLLIVVGMLLLVDLKEFEMDFLGIGLALLSAVTYGFYIVASKRISIDPMASTFLVCLGCAAGTALAAWGDDSLILPSDKEAWVYVLGFAIIATAVPILLLLRSLQYISSDKASIYSVTEPAFVVLFGVCLLQEHLTWQHVLGIVIILWGALITLFGEHLSEHPLLIKITKHLRG